MEAWAGTAAALEVVRQTGEHARRQGRIKGMGRPVSSFFLAFSRAMILSLRSIFFCSAGGNRGRSNGDRRWNPSFEPVRIELRVAERESQACGLVLEVSDVAFGPFHRLA